MNIPARSCNGYLGDIGVPPVEAPMDFSAWFEAYLERGWHTFDVRHTAKKVCGNFSIESVKLGNVGGWLGEIRLQAKLPQ